MLRNNIGEDAPPHVKFGGEPQVSGFHGLNQVIDDAIGYRLMECTLVAERPDIELEAFKLDAFLVGNVIKNQGSKIRLPGFRTQTGELRNFHVNMVIPRRRGVGESFQVFGGAARHSLISVKYLCQIG